MNVFINHCYSFDMHYSLFTYHLKKLISSIFRMGAPLCTIRPLLSPALELWSWITFYSGHISCLPRPQDRMLHRCQLGGRGFHMQWCSRVAFPVWRCAQLTCRDWKPWRPQVVVHGVQGPTRQRSAQACVEQFFREPGLPFRIHVNEGRGQRWAVTKYRNRTWVDFSSIYTLLVRLFSDYFLLPTFVHK